MHKVSGVVGLIAGWLACASALAGASERPPAVRAERPRVFIREKAWDGPSVEKLREWVKRDEYQRMLRKLPDKIGRGVYWLATGDDAAGRKAVEQFQAMKIAGETPSYSGISAQKYAAMYDWLHDHPAMTGEVRRNAVKHMEQWADGFMGTLKQGGPTPFYSRISGAIAGLTVIGLALHGDSPKADEYVRFAAQYLRDKIGTVRQVEDGATGGGTYGYHHEFTDLANMVAAWRSATDWDAAWIREHQGNWLERQLLFQIWTTYPNGWFVKDGDIWGGSHTDKTQLRMQIDAVTGMYRNGFGRTWADAMYGRWKEAVYHSEYVWEFFIFNDPEVKPLPLDGLGRAEVFSPKLHGFVCWRDSWKDDAVVIHFKCGETVDHHATYDQGRFTIFKRAPLAIKNGRYQGYKTAEHWYYKSPWSANVVIFDGPQNHGYQPFIDFDGTPSWAEWKAERDRRFPRPPTGVLKITEASDKYARALGDLSGSTHPTGSMWTRELVFLGYKYLLVLDRVKPGKDVKTRWLLHTVNEPEVNGMLVRADNGDGRLFCRTLLPDGAKIIKHGGNGRAFHHKDQNGNDVSFPVPAAPPEQMLGAWRLDVVPPDGGAECVYLHVLYPTDTDTAKMPECFLERAEAGLRIQVGELEHVFGR